MKKVIFCISFFVCLVPSTFASVWPVFFIPDGIRLLNQGLLTTDNCPVGMVRLVRDSDVGVGRFCQTYCPNSWVWHMTKGSQCFELSRTQVGEISIDHVRDDDGTTLYSVVQAALKDNVSGVVDVRFTFVTPRENWFCVVPNKEIAAVTCANDV